MHRSTLAALGALLLVAAACFAFLWTSTGAEPASLAPTGGSERLQVQGDGEADVAALDTRERPATEHAEEDSSTPPAREARDDAAKGLVVRVTRNGKPVPRALIHTSRNVPPTARFARSRRAFYLLQIDQARSTFRTAQRDENASTTAHCDDDGVARLALPRHDVFLFAFDKRAPEPGSYNVVWLKAKLEERAREVTIPLGETMRVEVQVRGKREGGRTRVRLAQKEFWLGHAEHEALGTTLSIEYPRWTPDPQPSEDGPVTAPRLTCSLASRPNGTSFAWNDPPPLVRLTQKRLAALEVRVFDLPGKPRPPGKDMHIAILPKGRAAVPPLGAPLVEIQDGVARAKLEPDFVYTVSLVPFGRQSVVEPLREGERRTIDYVIHDPRRAVTLTLLDAKGRAIEKGAFVAKTHARLRNGETKRSAQDVFLKGSPRLIVKLADEAPDAISWRMTLQRFQSSDTWIVERGAAPPEGVTPLGKHSLRELPLVASGRVVDEDGAAVAGATIRVQGLFGSRLTGFPQSCVSGADGSFRARHLEMAERFTLRCSAPEHMPFRSDVRRGTHGLTIRLARGYEQRITLEHSERLGQTMALRLSNAARALHLLDVRDGVGVVRAPRGEWALELVSRATALAVPTADGALATLGTLRIPSDGVRFDLSKVLCAREMRVVDSRGAAVGSAWLHLVGNRSPESKLRHHMSSQVSAGRAALVLVRGYRYKIQGDQRWRAPASFDPLEKNVLRLERRSSAILLFRGRIPVLRERGLASAWLAIIRRIGAAKNAGYKAVLFSANKTEVEVLGLEAGKYRVEACTPQDLTTNSVRGVHLGDFELRRGGEAQQRFEITLTQAAIDALEKRAQ